MCLTISKLYLFTHTSSHPQKCIDYSDDKWRKSTSIASRMITAKRQLPKSWQRNWLKLNSLPDKKSKSWIGSAASESLINSTIYLPQDSQPIFYSLHKILRARGLFWNSFSIADNYSDSWVEFYISCIMQKTEKISSSEWITRNTSQLYTDTIRFFQH